MANIDVIYNKNESLVMRLIDLDVNYPYAYGDGSGLGRRLFYEVTSYTPGGGAVQISREVYGGLEARISQGGEVTILFPDVNIELGDYEFKPFLDGTLCKIYWYCDTENGKRLASGSTSFICSDTVSEGIDIARLNIIPHPNGQADITVIASNADKNGTLKAEFYINGEVISHEYALSEISMPYQEITYAFNAMLPQSGEMIAVITVTNPDGESASRKFNIDYWADLTPAINSFAVYQINAETREIQCNWSVSSRGAYRWAVTASKTGSEESWQKASSGDTTVSQSEMSVSGITFDNYERYTVTLWVYYAENGQEYMAQAHTAITLSQYPNRNAKIVHDGFLTFHIEGLDTGYTADDRKAVYTFAEVPNTEAAVQTIEVSLEGGISGGANVTFPGDIYAQYYVWCDIYSADGQLMKALPMISVNYEGFLVEVTPHYALPDVYSLHWSIGYMFDIYFMFDNEIHRLDELGGDVFGDLISLVKPKDTLETYYCKGYNDGTVYIAYPYLDKTSSLCEVTVGMNEYDQQNVYINFDVNSLKVKPQLANLTASAQGNTVSCEVTLIDPAFHNEIIVSADGNEVTRFMSERYSSDISWQMQVSGDGEHIISVTAEVDGINTNTAKCAVFITNEERPPFFEWDIPKISGERVYISSGEINRLIDNINSVRNYRGLESYDIGRLSSGDVFTAEKYNYMVKAIREISGYGMYLDEVERGVRIEARHLNLLKNEINAVI